MALGAVITQFSGMMLAGATSAVPMAMLMVVLAVALALSFALLVGRKSS
jgi:hypothetical protein